jgi:hypothetical protein
MEPSRNMLSSLPGEDSNKYKIEKSKTPKFTKISSHNIYKKSNRI